MKKRDVNKLLQGLSLLQTIALVLIIVLIFLGIGLIFHTNQTRNKIIPQVVVVTEELKVNPSQDQDIIGDFILDHEYFAADEEILFEETKSESVEDITDINFDENSQNHLNDKKDNKINTIQENKEQKFPLVAVVIDDMGINRKRTLDIISLEAPLTSSFLTYGNDLMALATKAKSSGHEIMIHAPMEPKVNADLAPDTLKTNMDKEQIESLFTQMLKKFENIGVGGVNNHMGSKFTEDGKRMEYVMKILKNHNMFFLDSKTSAKSKGKKLAAQYNVDFIERDIFLDNENDYDYIQNQLKKVENIALNKGYAVAICHPKSQTYQALKDWIGGLKDKQIKLVHISEIVKTISN